MAISDSWVHLSIYLKEIVSLEIQEQTSFNSWKWNQYFILFITFLVTPAQQDSANDSPQNIQVGWPRQGQNTRYLSCQRSHLMESPCDIELERSEQRYVKYHLGENCWSDCNEMCARSDWLTAMIDFRSETWESHTYFPIADTGSTDANVIDQEEPQRLDSALYRWTLLTGNSQENITTYKHELMRGNQF